MYISTVIRKPLKLQQEAKFTKKALELLGDAGQEEYVPPQEEKEESVSHEA